MLTLSSACFASGMTVDTGSGARKLYRDDALHRRVLVGREVELRSAISDVVPLVFETREDGHGFRSRLAQVDDVHVVLVAGEAG